MKQSCSEIELVACGHINISSSLLLLIFYPAFIAKCCVICCQNLTFNTLCSWFPLHSSFFINKEGRNANHLDVLHIYLLDFTEYFFQRSQGYGCMAVNLNDSFYILWFLIRNL